MDIRVRVRDHKLQNFVIRLPDSQRHILRAWQMQGSREVENIMRGLAPYKTGTYRESIGTRLTPKGFVVWPNVEYAPFVEEDTRPHIIRPVRAQALRWFGVYGEPIFAQEVKHPGTEGQHVMRRTREQGRKVLQQLYRMLWREQM